ncbi:MTH1187 family thiamine-binding protein [Pseudodesulfovibrio indicus]|uniref:MTH1187 family thiamine-binding protein n=1 Tax=Pseudodesulfovibrio indicus TaxID=1716143 RepID=UPI00292FCCFB|nr:MTH1187 family thiamine-binding protein [Pseudodesulfovibrio indicus]
MSCVATFSLFPLERPEDGSLAPYVARSLRIVEASGLDHQLGPMGTVVEGEIEDVLNVIRQCHDAMRADCDRVYLTLAVDSRSGKDGRMASKVRSVEERLK